MSQMIVTSSSQPSGRSAAMPPGRMKLLFIRSPVAFSKNASNISRSRKPKIIIVVDARSIPFVASHITCEETRCSSDMSIRIQIARGGSSMPRSSSIAIAKTSSLFNGDR